MALTCVWKLSYAIKFGLLPTLGEKSGLSLRPEQVPQVRQALEQYRKVKETLEAISELNQQLLRLDRDEARGSQALAQESEQ